MADIFDSLSEAPSNSKTDIFDQIQEQPSRTRSVLSAPVKGAIKGLHETAALRDPIANVLGLNQMNPLQKKAIERILPTREEPLEKGLERAGRLGINAIGGTGSLLSKGARTLAGAGLGQLAEEVGAPEFVQNLAELSAFASPKFGKKILPTKSQNEAYQFLKEKGLSDREIAPLLKSERKIRAFSKLSEKGPKTKKLVTDIGDKLGEGYDVLKTQGEDKFIRGTNSVNFDDKLSAGINKISPAFGRLIEKDVESLRNKGFSQKNLIDFYQDINRVVKGQEGGKAVLNTLKPIVTEGLKEIDPKAANDFKKLNEFYVKKSILGKKLSPDFFDSFISKGKIYAAVGGLATLNPAILKTVIGKKALSFIFQELLINPRLQNLSNQMLKAISENKIPVTLKLLESFKKELGKKDPKIEKELDSVT